MSQKTLLILVQEKPSNVFPSKIQNFSGLDMKFGLFKASYRSFVSDVQDLARFA
jgi:hypothetical protein